MEESNLLGREALRMKRKRGVIPRRVWNALVDVVFSGIVTSGVGCRVSRNRNGTVIEVPRRPFTPGGEGYQHPFKLVGSYDETEEEYRLKAHVGRASTLVWKDNGASAAELATREIPIAYDTGTGVSGKLIGDEFSASSEGYLVLSDSTTYGVWLLVPIAGATGLVAPGAGEYLTIDTFFNEVSARIVADSTNTDAEDAGAMEDVAFYLGQVVTSDDGTMTIKQYRRSDVCLGASELPSGLISSDLPNSLGVGTDGALWVPPIVSEDTDNDLSAGSDGGAFYEEPP